MAKLSALQPADIRKVAIPVGDDDTLNLEVDASVLTIGWQGRVNEAIAREDGLAFAREFFTLVKEWDLEDDDGDVLPLTEDTIDQLSMATFGTLVTQVTEQLNPNAKAPQKSHKR